ncbi:MAG: ArgE/DapE family deacylase [Candidatus Bathyarchaeia archaeon]
MLSDVEDLAKALQKIVKKQARNYIEILRTIIKCKSVNPIFDNTSTEERCQRLIADFLNTLGYQIYLEEPCMAKLKKYEGLPGHIPGRNFKGRPNLIAIPPSSELKQNLLLFAGHIDTVGGNDPGWDTDPFSATIKNNHVFGRGTVDMKGAISAMLCALHTLTEFRLTPCVAFSSVVDEEAGGTGMLALADFLSSRPGVIGGALLGEPTHLSIATISRGILWGKIRVNGRSGHIEVRQPSWRKGGAVDAIEKSLYVIKAIRQLNRDWAKSGRKKDPLLPRPCRVEIAEIHGGHAPTSFAAQCELTINIQYLPSEQDERGTGSLVKREFENFLKKVAEKDAWLKHNPPIVEWILDADSYKIDPGHPLVKLCQQAMKLSGKRVQLSGVETHTDARALNAVAKIPVVILGPGHMHLAHQANERLSIKEYLDSIYIYALIGALWTQEKKL